MEQTLVGTNIRWIFHLKAFPPIILRAMLLLTVTLVIAVLVVSAQAKGLDASVVPDPFATFAEFFPGQALDTNILFKQGFSCVVDTLPTLAVVSELCTEALPSGTFSDINLTIWDGLVQQLDLKVRDNNLDVGKLSLQWGSPKIHIDGNWVNLSWPKQHVKGWGWSSNGQFTYFQALSHITFAI